MIQKEMHEPIVGKIFEDELYAKGEKVDIGAKSETRGRIQAKLMKGKPLPYFKPFGDKTLTGEHPLDDIQSK